MHPSTRTSSVGISQFRFRYTSDRMGKMDSEMRMPTAVNDIDDGTVDIE